MTEFKLIAYENENGEVPVEEFLDSVNPKMRAKIFGLLGILQEKGNMLREPYSKHLDDGIFGTHMYRHVYGVKLAEMHLDDWTI